MPPIEQSSSLETLYGEIPCSSSNQRSDSFSYLDAQFEAASAPTSIPAHSLSDLPPGEFSDLMGADADAADLYPHATRSQVTYQGQSNSGHSSLNIKTLDKSPIPPFLSSSSTVAKMTDSPSVASPPSNFVWLTRQRKKIVTCTTQERVLRRKLINFLYPGHPPPDLTSSNPEIPNPLRHVACVFISQDGKENIVGWKTSNNGPIHTGTLNAVLGSIRSESLEKRNTTIIEGPTVNRVPSTRTQALQADTAQERPLSIQDRKGEKPVRYSAYSNITRASRAPVSESSSELSSDAESEYTPGHTRDRTSGARERISGAIKDASLSRTSKIASSLRRPGPSSGSSPTSRQLGTGPGPASGPKTATFREISPPSVSGTTRAADGRYICMRTKGRQRCEMKFGRKGDLERHQRASHDRVRILCSGCGASLSRMDALHRHERKCAKVRREDQKDLKS